MSSWITSLQLKINRSQRSKILRGVWQEAKIEEKFAESRWNKNLEKDVVVSWKKGCFWGTVEGNILIFPKLHLILVLNSSFELQASPGLFPSLLSSFTSLAMNILFLLASVDLFSVIIILAFNFQVRISNIYPFALPAFIYYVYQLILALFFCRELFCYQTLTYYLVLSCPAVPCPALPFLPVPPPLTITLALQRSNMTDFDRYKLGRARQSRNKILNRVHFHIRKQHFKSLRVAKLKKAAKK